MARQPRHQHLGPVRIDEILPTYVQQVGCGPGYALHSVWATFITTVLDHGARLEDVQQTVGGADPSTTQLYDLRRFLPRKAAALVVGY